ncbi:MAG TPA: AAA family ATPase, partial [Pyrinomonadaceae bacterium]|nr:AAA family ATPase [Pyrinomonadaceae bacterium]
MTLINPINPRRLLKEKNGRERLYALLCNAGYVPQKEPLDEMCNAIFMATPIFLAGQRGGGKTAFLEALAKALGLPLFTLVGLPNTNTDYVLASWDRAAQQHYVGMELLNKTPFAEAQAKQWTRDFLKLGEVLEGFDYSARNKIPSVILCDEWDKTPEELDSALLQLLGRGFVNVPQLRPDNRLGFTPETSPEERYFSYPIVGLTSNNVREFSPPLLSRLWYCHIPSPSVPEMVRILASA